MKLRVVKYVVLRRQIHSKRRQQKKWTMVYASHVKQVVINEQEQCPVNVYANNLFKASSGNFKYFFMSVFFMMFMSPEFCAYVRMFHDQFWVSF